MPAALPATSSPRSVERTSDASNTPSSSGTSGAAGKLPSYAPMLTALHRAHEEELQRVIAKSPVSSGMRVLDVCCGDGAQTLWLARRVGYSGTVVGIDRDQDYLRLAADRARRASPSAGVYFLQGDAYALPFEAGSFDVAWCAHSLYDLDDPVRVLRQMRAVVHPGGSVCVLENDRLHHVLLPWPAELELALQRAYRQAVRRRRAGESERFYVARHLPRLFREAGLEEAHIEMQTTTRRGPLAPDERAYLDLYLDELVRHAWPHLSPDDRDAFARWRGGQTDAPAPEDTNFSVTYLDALAWAPVPA